MTAKYLNFIKPAIIRFFKEGNSSLSLVGSGHVDLGELPVKIIPWSEETEVADIKDFDVGIMQLPNSPWERGKWGDKLIQYMACARPVVASPVGVAPKIIENGINGFLATTTEDWVKAICALRRNYKLRERMGKAGRIKVERQYCIQVTAPILVSLLRGVVKEFN